MFNPTDYLVDAILAKNAALNQLREQDYVIRPQRDGATLIEIPYDVLLHSLQSADPGFPTLTLFEAQATGLLSIPAECDIGAQIGSNIYIPAKYPTSVVLRHNKLWLNVPGEDLRRYLVGYLSRPEWRDKTWDEIKNHASLPADADSLRLFFAREAEQIQQIDRLLSDIVQLDQEIDTRVLDLYGITDVADRQQILGSAPSIELEAEHSGEIESEAGELENEALSPMPLPEQ
jgi:hypothetical protein